MRAWTSAPPSSSARHLLAGRRLHQRWPAQKDGALIADDDAFIRHRRHISAAGGAGTHHHGDLGDAFRRHIGLIEEDATEMVAVGKDLVLVRQVGAARIDEIDAGQAVLLGDLLGAQMLLHRHREIGAALHGRVIDDDHAFAPRDAADPGEEAGGRHLPPVEAVRGELRELQEGRTHDRAASGPARAAAACRAQGASAAPLRRRPGARCRPYGADPRPRRASLPHSRETRASGC